MQASYVPFPPKPVRELTGKEKKLLDRADFVRIEPGEFLMGSPEHEIGHQATEAIHKVRITKPYYMAVSEVTIDQWNKLQPKILWKDESFFLTEDTKKAIKRLKKELPEEKSKELMLNPDERVYTVEILEKIVPIIQGKLDSAKNATKKKRKITWAIGNIELALKEVRSLINYRKYLPVTGVSYPQAKSFCWRRTEIAWRAAKIPKDMVFRLPTEAEWEYACRAGLKGVCGLEDGDKLSGMNANINGGKKEFIIGEKTYLINRKGLVSVGVSKTKYPANAWGLHDMHGNVYEWCYDFYDAYPTDEWTIDPIGPIRGKERVLRGGSFIRTAYDSRSAARRSVEPSWRGSETGFRLVLGYPL
jgi:formylglycine-generating enzyme required for sulfatase activity